jgi:hypothetical protein
MLNLVASAVNSMYPIFLRGKFSVKIQSSSISSFVNAVTLESTANGVVWSPIQPVIFYIMLRSTWMVDSCSFPYITSEGLKKTIS